MAGFSLMVCICINIIKLKNMATVAETILAIRCNFLIKYAVVITKKKYENIVRSKNALVFSLALKFILAKPSTKRESEVCSI